MTSQKRILIIAGTMVGASLLGAFGTVRVASAGDGDADRCPGEKLPLCREVDTCSGSSCVKNFYYFPNFE